MSNSRTRSIRRSYRNRIAALGGATTAPETAPAEEKPAPPEEAEDQLPRESWKKDDIIGWLLTNEVIESADDVDGLTKAQLLENFFDDEG